MEGKSGPAVCFVCFFFSFFSLRAEDNESPTAR